MKEDDNSNRVRYEALHSAVSYALQRTLEKLSLEAFTSSYPTVDKEALEFIRKQIIKAWSSKAELEFKRIFFERDLENKLNELDDIILKASEKFENDEFGIDVTKLSSLELIKCATTPVIRETNKELSNQLEKITETNARLENQLTEMKLSVEDDLKFLEEINKEFKNLDSIDTERLNNNYSDIIAWCVEEIGN